MGVSPAGLAKTVGLRCFAAGPPVTVESGAAPSVFDKIISLMIVDPSGARRKIKGMVGEFFKRDGSFIIVVLHWVIHFQTS
jgi:hypothetical protein